MAKLQSASIRLVQKMNRQNKNGEYPIYVVVCYKGRKEKACGISCLSKYWDGKREEIKRSCPNSAVLNKMLSDIKQRVIDKKNFYELNSKSYTPSMLLEDSVNDLDGRSNDFGLLMDGLIKERRLKDKTRMHYEYAYRKLCEFIGRKDFIVDEINLGFVKDFCRWLDISDASKRDVCGCIAAVWNYGISKRVLDRNDYPFDEFKFTQVFKQKFRDYCIDLGNMKKLKEYFLNLVIDRKEGGLWSYKEGALDRLHKRTSKEFGICYFLAMYHLNGSAPYDVAKLRVEDCERVMIEGVDYWKIEFKRQKSGTSVSVRLRRNMFSIILLEHFLGFSDGGYVYPVITKNAVTDKQIQGTINKCGESAIKWVREAFEEINKETIRRNVVEGLEEPLVDCRKVVLYTARHSFASNYLNTKGATVVGAASLLARSPNTISVYIHSLQNDKEIAEAASFLDD